MVAVLVNECSWITARFRWDDHFTQVILRLHIAKFVVDVLTQQSTHHLAFIVQKAKSNFGSIASIKLINL